MRETIKLFKAVTITENKLKPSKELINKINKATIGRGFLFSKEVFESYGEGELHNIINVVEADIGLTAEKLTNTFHKSWGKVKNAPMIQLVVEQIVHYITTYGYKKLGVFDDSTVYIPNEQLDIPNIDVSKIKLTIIKGYTKEEIKEKVLSLLQSGIALKDETMDDIVQICFFVGMSKEDVETIKNKEVKIKLYDFLTIIPENPTEFLRYTMYKITGKTLLIKNRETIESIKDNDNCAVHGHNMAISGLFVRYNYEYDIKRLSEIFYRFKPLFLAFKAHKASKSIINKIRKLAEEHHKPMKEDYLNTVTSRIKKGEKIDGGVLVEELEKANTFRRIRLAYALKYRTVDTEAIVYKIRNGKGYATDFNFENKTKANTVLKIVLSSILDKVKKNVDGKKIFIPENIKYTLPATEKQFIGNVPSGTYVSVPKDMVFGVHWEDVDNNTIDLDLSLINVDGKIGWDSAYRDEDKTILFSGDITSAPKPKGATELFYVKRNKKESHLMLCNYYNYDADINVPFKIIVAEQQISLLSKNHTIDPNKVKVIIKSNINVKQKVLGLIINTTDGCRFYFTESDMGAGNSSKNSKFIDDTRKYLTDYYKNTISLNDILGKSGATLVEDVKEADIDLSPENLEKDTIINLIK